MTSIFYGIPAPRNDWTILALHDLTEITVSRATGAYSTTTGRYAAGTASTFTTEAVIYPTSGDDLKRLPENRRDEATLTIFTTDLVQTSRANSHQADRLSGLPAPWDAETWEVLNVKAWPGNRFGYEALVQRVEQ
jgi:hypothetical protein